jgi:hypothetical protein
MPIITANTKLDDVVIDYRAETRIGGHEYDDECRYISDINADIVGVLMHPAEHHLVKKIPLGRLHLIRVHVSNACNDHVWLYDVFDERQETWDVSEVLFDGSFDEFGSSVGKMFPDSSPWNDILIINRVGISQKTRAHNLGANAIHQAVRDFGGGCSIVILKAFPLQFENDASTKPYWGELNLAAFSQNQKEATKRLAAYYKRMGFRKIGKTPYYAACRESNAFTKEKCLPLREISVPNAVINDESIPWLKIE